MTAPWLAFRVTLEGEVLVDRRLQAIEARMSDVGPAWPAVIKTFREIMAKSFATEGRSTGAAWPELVDTTQAERRRLGFPPAHPILERTGKLKRALVLGEGGDIRSTPRRLTIGVGPEADYFVYHQSNRPRTRLPRRAPVLLTADDKTALMHPVRLYVTGHDPNARRRAPIL
jgi:hypothetical protein